MNRSLLIFLVGIFSFSPAHASNAIDLICINAFHEHFDVAEWLNQVAPHAPSASGEVSNVAIRTSLEAAANDIIFNQIQQFELGEYRQALIWQDEQQVKTTKAAYEAAMKSSLKAFTERAKVRYQTFNDGTKSVIEVKVLYGFGYDAYKVAFLNSDPFQPIALVRVNHAHGGDVGDLFREPFEIRTAVGDPAKLKEIAQKSLLDRASQMRFDLQARTDVVHQLTVFLQGFSETDLRIMVEKASEGYTADLREKVNFLSIEKFAESYIGYLRQNFSNTALDDVLRATFDGIDAVSADVKAGRGRLSYPKRRTYANLERMKYASHEIKIAGEMPGRATVVRWVYLTFEIPRADALSYLKPLFQNAADFEMVSKNETDMDFLLAVTNAILTGKVAWQSVRNLTSLMEEYHGLGNYFE